MTRTARRSLDLRRSLPATAEGVYIGWLAGIEFLATVCSQLAVA